MIHQAKSLIKFLRLSKNKHGIHSPFVYSFVTNCFNDNTKYSEYAILKRYRKALQADNSLIKMTEFGEGSRVFKGLNRKVSAVYRNAGMKKNRQKLLFRIAAYLQCENILEFGTSLGSGTIALSLSNSFAEVHTVEACSNTAKVANEYFKKFDVPNIELHNETFEAFLKNTSDKYDLIFLDGDHNGERTITYFNSLLNQVHNATIMIFDDIYWSKDMTDAWQKIIENETVTVSIDTFQWGIVFFRKEQPKQHFIIRI